MNVERIVIIGAGAVGGSIGGLLCDCGIDVTLVARGEHGAKIRSEGLNVKFPNRTVAVKPTCVESIGEIKWQHNDVCLIATKLNDALSVLDELSAAAGNGIPVVCTFNGIQGETWASERFQTVASIMIWMPSTHLFPGDVRVYGETCPGVLDIGPVTGEGCLELCNQLAERLRQAGFDSLARNDIQRWKYAKWITNLGNTAQALITDDWKRVLKAAQAEGEAVFEAAKIDRIRTPDLLERCKMVDLKPIDGERRSGGSTWQSHQRGKRLETPWIEGALAELADQFNVPAPVNKKLAELAELRKNATAAEVLGS